MARGYVLTSESLQKTALHQWHSASGGRMVDFAGWSMPVQYSSIIDEHHFTRQAAGMFDVSHMGRLVFPEGDASLAVLEKLTTRRIDSMKTGQIRYSLLTNETGGVLDDVLVYRLADHDGKPLVMMVVNASNRAKIVDWLNAHWPSDVAKPEDRTLGTAMIAVQGPLANRIVAGKSDIDPASLSYYHGAPANVCGHQAMVTRTGYTGEDGCELIIDNKFAVDVWTELHQASIEQNGGACGLASRDTLRLEAGMPLYGHELNEQINAGQTKLGFAINLKDRTFPGRDAIAAARTDDSLPVRAGLELVGKRAARQGCPILVDDQPVGTVTSGTFAPTVQRSISMAYVAPQCSQPGTEVSIDIRGKHQLAKVVALPFYERKS